MGLIFPKMGGKKTRKSSQRRCHLNLVPNSMQKVFQRHKKEKEIPAGGKVCAKALGHEKIAQTVFGKHERVQLEGLLVIRLESRSQMLEAGNARYELLLFPWDLKLPLIRSTKGRWKETLPVGVYTMAFLYLKSLV